MLDTYVDLEDKKFFSIISLNIILFIKLKFKMCKNFNNTSKQRNLHRVFFNSSNMYLLIFDWYSGYTDQSKKSRKKVEY